MADKGPRSAVDMVMANRIGESVSRAAGSSISSVRSSA
jgi:hypothetical protein